MNEIINSLDKRLDDVQQIFDKAWEENKIPTPPNSLSRLCASLTPGIAQDIQVAINALREKQERDKGCEYCQQGEEMAYGQDSMKRTAYIYLDGNLLVADLYSESMAVAVCYCPMCGKRLEEHHA